MQSICSQNDNFANQISELNIALSNTTPFGIGDNVIELEADITEYTAIEDCYVEASGVCNTSSGQHNIQLMLNNGIHARETVIGNEGAGVYCYIPVRKSQTVTVSGTALSRINPLKVYTH